jgi:hypothetical protein
MGDSSKNFQSNISWLAKRLEQNPLWLAGLLGVLAVLALIFIPSYQISHLSAVPRDAAKRFGLEDEARKTLSQIVLSAFGLFALYFAWKRVVAGDRTVRITEQGHITDRYTKAIEQLGKLDGDKPNIEVRLGGIYALERIALDSERDHWTIMEVLTAYVRQNAPVVSKRAEQTQLSTDLENERSDTKAEPRTDIQAILTVLGRRERGKSRERANQILNLSRTNLEGASLDEAHLEGANMTGAHLERADLMHAHLDGANLTWACLERANLTWAHLEGANLTQAHLERASITVDQLKVAESREAPTTT